MTDPAVSTMQTLLVFSETSMPTEWVITVPPLSASPAELSGRTTSRGSLAAAPTRLPFLTKPSLDEAPRDEGCGEGQECEVEIVSSLVADGQAPELAEPRQRA